MLTKLHLSTFVTPYLLISCDLLHDGNSDEYNTVNKWQLLYCTSASSDRPWWPWRRSFDLVLYPCRT